MESILTSIKQKLGIDELDESFDVDVIMDINMAFETLNDLGVGPSDGFVIEDKTATWMDFTQGDKGLESVKTYIYLKVRIVFDPPASSIVMDAMSRSISELEWRLCNRRREEEIQNG